MTLIIDPSTLSPSAWYTAEDIPWGDGDSVATWPDKSGNAHDLTQGTAANKPKVYLDVTNGRKALRFDGTNDFLQSAAAFSHFVGANGLGTVIAVVRNIDNLVSHPIWSVHTASGSEHTLVPTVSPMRLDAIENDGAVVTVPRNLPTFEACDVLQVMTDARAGYLVTCWMHDTAIATVKLYCGANNLDTAGLNSSAVGNCAAGVLAGLVNVGKNFAGTTFWYGDILELIFFPTALTEAQRRGVQLYLTNRYALAYGSGLSDDGGAVAPMRVDMKLPTTVLQLSPTAWYKADAIVGYVTGADLTTWIDSSGNGYDISQAVAAAKPHYTTGVVNGLPAVLFDGTNDILSTAVATVNSILGSSGRGTVYMMTYPTTAAGAHDHLIWASAVAAGGTRCTTIEDGAAAAVFHAYNYDGTTDDAAIATVLSAWRATCWTRYLGATYVYAGESSFGFDNGHMTEVASGATTDLAELLNVGGHTGLGDYFKGYIAEILFFRECHTQPERRHVHSYLAAKYGLTYATSHGLTVYEPMWVDVTSDIRAADGLSFDYGIRGATVKDRCASAGTLKLSMENSPASSGGIVGYYSPNLAARRTGFAIGVPVRVSFLYYGTRYYKWRGTISDLKPIPGKENHIVQVIAMDYMDEMARTTLNKIALQTDVRADEVIGTILVEVPRLPESWSIGIGTDEYPFAIDNSQDEKTTAIAEFHRCAMSELGYVYIRGDAHAGGKLIFEPRGLRTLLSTTRWAMTDSYIYGLELTHSVDEIVNRAIVTLHPRRVDIQLVILFDLATFPVIDVGDTLTFTAPYRAPDTGRYVRCGGTGMVFPIRNTDYGFNSQEDGLGADYGTQLTVLVGGDPTPGIWGANSATLSFYNAGPNVGYLTHCALRGYGVASYEAVVIDTIDAASVLAYGENAEAVDMPYQSDLNMGSDVTAFIVAKNKDPRTRVKSVLIKANVSSTAMIHALNREIGDRITITEATSGLSGQGYYIQAIQFDVSQGAPWIVVKWLLVPVETDDCWLLEIPTRSELEVTTTLGYTGA